MNGRPFLIVTISLVILGSGMVLQADPSAGPTWPSLGGDFRRAGLSRDQGPTAGGIKWKYEIGGVVASSVTVGVDGRIHVACEDGKLYTLNAEGKPLWVHDVGHPLLSAPTIGGDGNLYVGSRDGMLFAIDSEGRLQWSRLLGGAIYSSPAVGSNGTVYVGSADGALYALGQNGMEVWRFKTKGPGAVPSGAVFASPAIGADGAVYIAGLYDPNLYALNPADGSIKWACRFPANSQDPNSGGWPFASPVVAADGTIYQTLLYDRHLYAIDPATGAIRWSVVFADPTIVSDQGKTIQGDGDGWSEPVLGPDGTIYVGFDDPYLHAVDPKGIVKWAKPFGEVGGFTMTADRNGTVYAASDDGYVYVVASDGSLITRFDPGGWPAFPVIAADGVLILVDSKDYSSLKTAAKNAVWAISAENLTKP